MSGYLSTRTTLCLLAGLGALTGGVAGAAIVGKLATDGSAGATVQRDKPAAMPLSRATQVAALAAQSPSRLPTPWSATGATAARATGASHRASRQAARKPPARRAAAQAGVVRAAAPARSRRVSAPRPVPTAPVTAPAAPQAQAPARTPIRSPAPARGPEAAPKASRPSPEPAPARSTPKPDPTGAFDDSG